MRGRQRLVMIERPRIGARLEATPLVVLEAPGGYGKSTVCAQLAASLDLATIRVVLRGPVGTTGLLSTIALGCRRAGLATMADSIDVEDPEATIDALTDGLRASGRGILLTVDEVQRADREAAAWLARLATGLPDGIRLAVAGRRLGPALAQLSENADADILGVEALRFDHDEIGAVLAAVRAGPPGPDDVEAILAVTDGWPAAVILAAHMSAHRREMPLAGTTGASVLRVLTDDLLEAADPTARDLVEAIADLPLLSTAVLAAIGGEGALDRVLDAGMPIRFRADGWGELPDPVRELFPRRALPCEQARSVARIYADRGELTEAAALLHRAGDHDGVAALLAGQRRPALERAGLHFFDAILANTPDVSLLRHPPALVHLVRAAERQPRLRRAWIDRAMQVLPVGASERRAIAAEGALDDARAGDLEEATRTADGILASAGRDEVVTRGRAHLVRALCAIVMDTAGDTADVTLELEFAIGQFSLAGERGWEAEAHQALGYGCNFTTGAHQLAADRLERALALRPAPDAARASTLTFLAEVLTRIGRLDEAAVALREATTIGQRLGDSRAIGYAAWSGAELACQRRDLPAAVSAIAQAEGHPEGWFDGLAGVDFLSHAAEIRAILGDEEGAWRDLARAEARAEGTARAGAPLSARARLEAAFGEPNVAVGHLDALDGSALAYPGDRWVRLLLRAVCAARLGDREGAAILVRRSREVAIELGDPDAPGRREPELLALAAPGEERAATTATVTVTLLGRFAVERDGIDVSPQPGRPATLVKLVALQGTLTSDEAIDVLWPDADFDTGRQRLRNLLNRVRATSGALISRRDGALSLEGRVSVDAHRFEEEADAALSAPRDQRIGQCRRALTRSTGELLPADRYADWATVPRERLRRRHLALLDLVAEDAIARGDLDEAGRLLDTAISSDPVEELRYVRLARALMAQGRTRRARRVADQGLAVAADLGVKPGVELDALVTELVGQP